MYENVLFISYFDILLRNIIQWNIPNKGQVDNELVSCLNTCVFYWIPFCVRTCISSTEWFFLSSYCQVVRGVIPGAGPQPEYHPNPYLQHIYSRHASREDTHDNLVDIGDIEAHLQEVISHSAQNLVETETGEFCFTKYSEQIDSLIFSLGVEPGSHFSSVIF